MPDEMQERRGGHGVSSPSGPPEIVGLGMATVDLMALVPRLPGPDEVYEIDELVVEGGGPVASALAAASRLGAHAALVGSTDVSTWGELIVEGLRSCRVNVDHLLRRAEGSAPRSVILVEASSGRRSILYNPGSVSSPKPDELPQQLISSARVLHLDGFHAESALAAASLARSEGVLVSLDGGAGVSWPGLEDLLPLVDVLIVARAFALEQTGIEEERGAIEALARHGATHVVVTDGERGAWSLVDGVQRHANAFDVDVVDTTGAGDAFHGGYLHALLRGHDPEVCLTRASAVAALACTRLGGRAGLPSDDQLDAFLLSHCPGFAPLQR